MKYSLLVFFIFIPFLLLAQGLKLVIKGTVSNVSHVPIAYATIQNIETGDGANADILGYYIFHTTLPAVLKASFIGYKTALKKIPQEQGKDTIRIDFVLESDSTQLQTVEVTATNQPELLKESGDLLDFETKQNKLWLLYHHKRGDHLEIYDSGTHYLTRIVLTHHSETLNKTPHGFVYIENSDSVRLFDYKVNTKDINGSSLSSVNFHVFINHLATYSFPYYYYLWNGFDSSAIGYWYFNKQTQKYGRLYFYQNIMLKRLNDDNLDSIYSLNQQLYDEQGASIEMGEQKGYTALTGEIPRKIEKKISTLAMLVRNIYCPLKIIHDSIFIFNFDNDSIYVFNLKNKKVRQMPLAFRIHGMKYKEKDILVDEENGESYYKFVLGTETYLQKIDLGTGKGINTQKIGIVFPEKIRIMAGYAYYTNSGYEDNQMFIRHLYRQKL